MTGYTEKIRELIDDIYRFGENLTDQEIKFIFDLIDNPPERYSVKQINIINRIYDKKCQETAKEFILITD